MPSIMPDDLAGVLAELGRARRARVGAYEAYKEFKAYEDDLRDKLSVILKESHLKSAKGDEFSASFVEKPTIIITHEQSVIEWLRETPDIEADSYIGIKPVAFQSLATSLLKNTGELIDGTTLEVKESLMINSNKKKG